MYEARVVADSIAYGHRLTSMLVTCPRFILAEINTHKRFSRNSASSRAIPTHKRIEAVVAEPFVPDEWLANQAGMQGGAALPAWAQDEARKAWLELRDASVRCAARLNELGVHKQWANRPLELHGWHTVLITSCYWRNFFAQRVSPQAQPEFEEIAGQMLDAMHASKPVVLGDGEWHLPFIDVDEGFELGRTIGLEGTVKVSVARCARTSYLTHDGVRDPQEDIRLHDRLLGSGHMSPFEHVAQVDSDCRTHESGNFTWPWAQYRKMLADESEAAPAAGLNLEGIP